MAQVQLESPFKYRERILAFGGSGTGKTTAVLSVARRLKIGKMWIIDNDFSYAYARALATDFTDIDPERVEVIEVGDKWADMRAALERVVAEGDNEHDWLVVDSLSPTWDAVQDWYTSTVLDSTMSEYLVQVRAKTDNMSDFGKAMMDGRWTFINREYFEGFYGPIRKWHGHLLLTAEAKALSSQADAEEKELYGHLGVGPVGQKRLKHICHTNLYLVKKGPGDYRLTTVKDRNREEQERMVVEDFAMDYLRGVAGWKVVVAKKPAAATDAAEVVE